MQPDFWNYLSSLNHPLKANIWEKAKIWIQVLVILLLLYLKKKMQWEEFTCIKILTKNKSLIIHINS